ncbi:MAG: hypothetical protein AAF743_08560 [Planctomycetota bacterium]
MKGTLRVIGMLVLSAGAGGGLWYYQHTHSTAAKIDQLQAEKAVLADLVDRLSGERRVAEMIVTDQRRDDEGTLETDLLFVEYDRAGEPLPPKSFTVRGDSVHVLSKVITFERGYLESDDPMRGQSIALFLGIHGGAEAPEDAHPIDPEGGRPDIYAGDDPTITTFETELWSKFWDLARDEQLRTDYGVKSAGGEGPWTIFQPDTLYTLTLANDGGLTLQQRPVPAIFRVRE